MIETGLPPFHVKKTGGSGEYIQPVGWFPMRLRSVLIAPQERVESVFSAQTRDLMGNCG